MLAILGVALLSPAVPGYGRQSARTAARFTPGSGLGAEGSANTADWRPLPPGPHRRSTSTRWPALNSLLQVYREAWRPTHARSASSMTVPGPALAAVNSAWLSSPRCLPMNHPGLRGAVGSVRAGPQCRRLQTRSGTVQRPKGGASEVPRHRWPVRAHQMLCRLERHPQTRRAMGALSHPPGQTPSGTNASHQREHAGPQDCDIDAGVTGKADLAVGGIQLVERLHAGRLAQHEHNL